MPERISGGPHVAVATLCDRVLHEQDGALSLIRIVDRFTISGATEQMPPAQVQTTLVIVFRTGALAVGAYMIKIRLIHPNAAASLVTEHRAFFDGREEASVNLIASLNLMLKEEGLYWIDVLFEDALVTRIPMRVLYQRTGHNPQTTTPSEE